jgi:hypothetical protein
MAGTQGRRARTSIIVSAAVGVLWSQAAKATTYLDAMDGGTWTSVFMGGVVPSAPVYVTKLFSISADDRDLDFGSIILGSWVRGVSSHSGVAFTSTVKMAYGPVSYFGGDISIVNGPCGTSPLGGPCPLPSPTNLNLRFTAPDSATLIQLVFMGEAFTYTAPSATVTTLTTAVPGPVTGAGIPALASLLGWFWLRRRAARA